MLMTPWSPESLIQVIQETTYAWNKSKGAGKKAI